VNILDRLVAYVSPESAFRRSRFRALMAGYESSRPSTLRKFSHDHFSGDLHARKEARAIRAQARHLDRNHDLARGALSTMVNNIVGPNGIAIEPQPRSVSGEILDDVALQLSKLWKDFCQTPEVTYMHNMAACQRLMCRTWLRDGESFAQLLEGNVPLLDHRTKVPLSIELLEPEQVPTEDELFIKDGQGGIARNAWGQAKAYRVFKVHPGNGYLNLMNYMTQSQDIRIIPAERMLHLKLIDRIGQSRGVSIFASVITRLEDLKDYEESERIAAKIAASMAAYIKKGTPDLYDGNKDSNGNPIARSMRFQPGMIFDDLAPGEEIGTIDTNRPNVNLPAHRDGQLRAAAAGLGTSHSSLSRNYNGTYSAQRQELVEQWVHYAVLAEAFTSQIVEPLWKRFVALAELSGLLKLPGELDRDTLDDALFISQQMPWIDPKKEAEGLQLLEENNYISGPEIIRRRGANPRDVVDQQAKWERMKKDANLAPKPSASPVSVIHPDPNLPESQQ
jgi:lambda family phage portal protein